MQRKNKPVPPEETGSQCTRRLNLERKKLKCLGCGRMMITNRCHRFCSACLRRNRRNQWHLPRQASIVLAGEPVV